MGQADAARESADTYDQSRGSRLLMWFVTSLWQPAGEPDVPAGPDTDGPGKIHRPVTPSWARVITVIVLAVLFGG